MARNSIFKHVRALHPGRTAFDLSKSHSFDCDAGALIPVYCEEVVPGDTFKMANRVLVRMAPMIAPTFSSWRVATWTFFVPNRLLMPQFEEFISGGRDGNQEIPIPTSPPYLYTNTSFYVEDNIKAGSVAVPYDNQTGFYIRQEHFVGGSVRLYKWSFWDYIGYPMPLMSGKSYTYDSWDTKFQYPYIPNVHCPGTSIPTFWPYASYLFIYNEYFRDENLEPRFIYAPTDLNQAYLVGSNYTALEKYIGDPYVVAPPLNFPSSIRTKCWNKDYFTSALPFQQRGTPPAIPISGEASVDFNLPVQDYNDSTGSFSAFGAAFNLNNPDPSQTPRNVFGLFPFKGSATVPVNTSSTTVQRPVNIDTNAMLSRYNTVNLGNLATVSVSDLRDMFQTQKWLERNARAGVRYKEFLYSHFGVNLRDDRLQRPEYIGGTNSPIMISQVLQTSQSSSDSPLGEYGGYGISADSTRIGTYYVREYGWIMTLLCIYPDITYNQGIRRQYTRRSRLDYFFPEFVNLSEQAVLTRELYTNFSGDSDAWVSDELIFGYQGRYNEYRSSYNQVSGSMRDDSLGYYVVRRDFDKAPTLEPSFIHMQPDKLRGIFAVQSQPPFIVDYATLVRAVRPMPYIPEPGLIDHH